jgi:mRNA interferase RelE/StbE
MPKYKIDIKPAAQKQLDKLPNADAEIIIDVILKLSNNPRPIGYKKLKGRNGYRIRKGNYRIIYEIFDKLLLIDIIKVGDRKDIYN